MNIRRVAAVVAVVAIIAAVVSITGSRSANRCAPPPQMISPEIIRLPPIESEFGSSAQLASAATADAEHPTIQRLPEIASSTTITRLPRVLLKSPTASALFLADKHQREFDNELASDSDESTSPAASDVARRDLPPPAASAPPIVPAPIVPAPIVSAPIVSAPIVSAPIVSAPSVSAPTVSPASGESDGPHQSIYAGNGPLSGDYDFERSMEVSADFETELVPLRVSPEELAKIRVPEDVARRANELLESAISLADRGAIYAARREFLRVTRMIAQALDAQLGQPYHTRALAAGLRALEEADDFALVSHDEADDDVRLGAFTAGHRTPVLQGVATNELMPLVAMQRYYVYAQRQLALAGGHEPTASVALFSMGRAESLLKQDNTSAVQSGPKAIAFFQAALDVDPTNAKAANELAVMLAEHGQLRRAVDVLKGAMTGTASRTMVQNYAQVCSRLGDERAAADARQIAQMMPPQPSAPVRNRPQVEWVPPAAFASGLQPDDPASQPTAATAPMAIPPARRPGSQPRGSLAEQPNTQRWPMF